MIPTVCYSIPADQKIIESFSGSNWVYLSRIQCTGGHYSRTTAPLRPRLSKLDLVSRVGDWDPTKREVWCNRPIPTPLKRFTFSSTTVFEGSDFPYRKTVPLKTGKTSYDIKLVDLTIVSCHLRGIYRQLTYLWLFCLSFKRTPSEDIFYPMWNNEVYEALRHCLTSIRSVGGSSLSRKPQLFV